jgi:hypothetical protein
MTGVTGSLPTGAVHCCREASQRAGHKPRPLCCSPVTTSHCYMSPPTSCCLLGRQTPGGYPQPGQQRHTGGGLARSHSRWCCLQAGDHGTQDRMPTGQVAAPSRLDKPEDLIQLCSQTPGHHCFELSCTRQTCCWCSQPLKSRVHKPRMTGSRHLPGVSVQSPVLTPALSAVHTWV